MMNAGDLSRMRLRKASILVESDRAYASGPRRARTLRRLMQKGDESAGLRLESSQSKPGAFVGISRRYCGRQSCSWADADTAVLDRKRMRIIDVLEGVAIAAK
jgi:CRP/FNR family transcriptional regulator, cyclic AMP receptor protein